MPTRSMTSQHWKRETDKLFIDIILNHRDLWLAGPERKTDKLFIDIILCHQDL